MDEYFLAETLKLAKKGLGWVNPNPMVGAVLVKDGTVIGKGYHKMAGYPHAEVEALKSCRQTPEGATLYVNLEPCTHFGKTPPCVDEIIRVGIKRVVCSTLDPNPKVHGEGVAKLKQAGIEVVTGILPDKARLLNEAFFTFHEKGRPFVAIKFAASLDGKMATSTGDSKWITNEKARRFARSLRGQYQAVLVGINTILQDDPHLGVRSKGRKDPIRIILDSRLQIPPSAKVLRDKNVIIATTSRANRRKLNQMRKNFEVAVCEGKEGEVSVKELLDYLRRREIASCLVEGGSQVLGSFVDEKLVDKVYAFHAPILIGGEEAKVIGGEGVKKIKDVFKLHNVIYKKLGDNMLTIGYTS